MALHIMGLGRQAWEWIAMLVRTWVGPQNSRPAEFEDWKSMQSTALAKRLRAEDIKAQTGSMVNNDCFLNNKLKALAIKEDMVRPTQEQLPLFPEKWEGTIDRAQFLKKGQHSDNEYDVEIFQEIAVEWNCRRD